MPPPAIAAYPSRNMIRNTLKDGLRFEQTLGVNPWKLGFVGSTDTHDATPGNTGEEGWTGAHGANDASPARLISDEVRRQPGRPGRRVGGGELARRDLQALRRRETYATSGTRPVVRFFAGDLDGVRCGRPDFVERAYTTGTPMGGDVGAVRGDARPALRRVGREGSRARADRPGTDLQRIQIVKGWVDTAGDDARARLRRGRRRRERRRRRSRHLRADGQRRARAVRGLGGPGLRPAGAPSTTRASWRTRPAAGARASARRPASIRSRPTAPRRPPRRARDFANCCLGATAPTRSSRRRSRSARGRRRSGTARRGSRACAHA